MNRFLAGVAVGDPLSHAKAVAAVGGAPRPEMPEGIAGHLEYGYDHDEGFVRVYSNGAEPDGERLVTCVTAERTAPSDGSDVVQAGYDDALVRFTTRYGDTPDVREETLGVIQIVRHRWVFDGLAATIQYDRERGEPFYLLVKLETRATGF